MDYAAKVQRTAAKYVATYGEDAIELIRGFCIEAHAERNFIALRVARDVGMAAEEILAVWSDRVSDDPLDRFRGR
jgi:hypothetical protein